MELHAPSRTLRLGAPLQNARAAAILLHGRGSSADDISGLIRYFSGDEIAFFVPEATGNTWYPQRFLAPLENNEPWLSSALSVIRSHIDEATAAGLGAERIALVGFSQGACLSLEYAARSPRRYGFVAGLSGGLIGPLDTARPAIDLQGTPVLVACAEADAHIPLSHVEHSAAYFDRSGAAVTKQIYRGSAHTVFPEEIAWLRQHAALLHGTA